MPTIDDILNRIGVTSETTADSQMEKEAQELGLIDNETTQIEGDRMNLKDFYDNHFDGGLEKRASTQREDGAQEFEKEANYNLGTMARQSFDRQLSRRLSRVGSGMDKVASTQYNMGAVARDTFDYLLSDRLNRFSLIKQAMEDAGSPESAATQAASGGSPVISGGLHGDPQMEVNRPSDASDSIDTDPEYYDLAMDSAVEKARLEKALAEGSEGDIRGTHNMDSGMEEPDSQESA